MRVADGSVDQERLGGVGKVVLRSGQDLQGPGLVPAVPAVMRGMADGDVCPVQRVEGSEQGRLIVLDRGEQVIGALVLDQVASRVLLDMQRIGRHQGPGDIHLLQQRLNLRDLVGLDVYVPLGDHRPGAADHRRQQVRRFIVPGPCAAYRLAVQRDDQRRRHRPGRPSPGP